MQNTKSRLKNKTVLIIILILLVLLFPVPDYSVQIFEGSSRPLQPLFLYFLPRCGKGNVVCGVFYRIWEMFYYLYN